MDGVILPGITSGAALITGLVAWVPARMMARPGVEVGFIAVLLATLFSLAVLLAASRLAVVADWAFARAGAAAGNGLGGQFFIIAFAASFIPIISCVVTFLLTFRKHKGRPA